MVGSFQQICFIDGDPYECLRWAGCGDGTLVTIKAAVVANLQKQRTVSESVASLDTFRASVAKVVFNAIFVIGMLDEFSFYGTCRAELIFGSGVKLDRFGLIVTGAEFAISAHGVLVGTFNSRFFEDAIRRTVTARYTFLGIDLPDEIFAPGFACQ